MEQQLAFALASRFDNADNPRNNKSIRSVTHISFEEINVYSKAIVAAENQDITEAIALLENLVRNNSQFNFAFKTLLELEKDSVMKYTSAMNEIKTFEAEILKRVEYFQKMIDKNNYTPEYYASLLALSLYTECIDTPAEYSYRKKTGAPTLDGGRNLSGLYEKHFRFVQRYSSQTEWQNAQKSYEFRKNYSRYLLLKFWDDWQKNVPVEKSKKIWSKVLAILSTEEKYFDYISENMYDKNKLSWHERENFSAKMISMAQKRFVMPFSMIPPFAAYLTREDWRDSFFKLTNLSNYYTSIKNTNANDFFDYPFYVLSFEWIIFEFKLPSDWSNGLPMRQFNEKYKKQRLMSAISYSLSILNYYKNTNLLKPELGDYFLGKIILFTQNINMETLSNQEINHIISVLNASYPFIREVKQKWEISRLQLKFTRLLQRKISEKSALENKGSNKKILFIIDDKTIIGGEPFRSNDTYDVVSFLITEVLALKNDTCFNIYGADISPLFSSSKLATMENCMQIRKLERDFRNSTEKFFRQGLDNQYAYFKDYSTRIRSYRQFLQEIKQCKDLKIYLIYKSADMISLQELKFTPNQLADAMNEQPDWDVTFEKILLPLIQKNADTNSFDRFGNTLLSYFVNKKDHKRVRILLNNGGDISFADQMNAEIPVQSYSYYKRSNPNKILTCTLLECAVRNADSEMVEILLNNSTHKYDKKDITNVFRYSIKEMFEDCCTILVKFGADPNDDYGKNTFLEHICRFSSLYKKKSLELLLKAGADPNRNRETSPLFELISNGGDSSWIEPLIKANASLSFTDNEGNSLLHAACKYGDRYSRKKDNVLNHSLQAAIFLVNNGVPINQKNIHGQTPWIIYCENHSGDLNIEFIVFFVKNGGADLAYRNSEGNSILHLAARRGNTEIIDLLLKNGATINLKNNDGKTPWMSYCDACTPNLDVIKLFVENNGADLSYRDNRGNTLLHIAARRGDLRLIEFLLQQGLSPAVENNAGRTPAQVSSKRNVRSFIESWVQNEATE